MTDPEIQRWKGLRGMPSGPVDGDDIRALLKELTSELAARRAEEEARVKTRDSRRLWGALAAVSGLVLAAMVAYEQGIVSAEKIGAVIEWGVKRVRAEQNLEQQLDALGRQIAVLTAIETANAQACWQIQSRLKAPVKTEGRRVTPRLAE